MKNHILPSMLGLALLAGNASALTPVKESFTGPTLNATRWFHYHQESGFLGQNKNKLNYMTQGATTKKDFASIELMTSYPGYNESWQLTLDLSNKAKGGKKAACGIMLFNKGDRSDYLFLEFYGTSGIEAGILTDGVHTKKNHISIPKAAAKGSLRVSFDKTTKLMSLELSATNKAEGYKWFPVGTFSPKNSKGANVRANWKMDPATGSFGVQLFGFGYGVNVAKAKMTYDNLEISAK
ncbi:MAG: hypothetical protein EOP88_06860 [Verrucomicrobiaceae bacterium]|nr:MAG: hypothetical protein EOP88_06860 [Verrucomicrobiaceae bacterium]